MTSPSTTKISPVEVRQDLADALRLDLVGPGELLGSKGRVLGDLSETLEQRPSTWYLIGFLVPTDAEASQKVDEQSSDEMVEIANEHSSDDEVTPEPAAAAVRYLPSSMGISVLVPKGSKELSVTVRWGAYKPKSQLNEDQSMRTIVWERVQHEETMPIDIHSRSVHPLNILVPNSSGLSIVVSCQPFATDGLEECLSEGTRSVALFLVNKNKPSPDEYRDESFAFQAQIEVKCDDGFVPRPDLHCLQSIEWDDRVADLQYRDVFEFAVGHGIATETIISDHGDCSVVRTCWIPGAEVERVAPTTLTGVTLSQEELANLNSGPEVQSNLGALFVEYSNWIQNQRSKIASSWPQRRQETAQDLVQRAQYAADRIKQGIDLLASNPQALEAFRIANKVMAMASRRRFGTMQGKDLASVSPPQWRPFQLAFLLMNLSGITSPEHSSREVVDLLFFPTGGGKTEAYLGLAAFTLVLRRLKNPGVMSSGLSVLMRYTLRLLTLDQLGRAATLICALELERQLDVEKLGAWPFEIGLWVGKAATPNILGEIGEAGRDSARARLREYQKDEQHNPSPIPLENCPWCGEKFGKGSFRLSPNHDHPTNLLVFCLNRRCEFFRDNPLPILAVDEPIYRRLPCFMVATVDKFAALPWTAEVGQFTGRVHRYDQEGFYGPSTPTRGNPLPSENLPPPDLIIQDELHLISGPLGTIAGLYETALEELCTYESNGKKIRPKIIASTATVRRAEHQIRALFNRSAVEIFPPPGPERRDSFFAETHTTERSNARLYLGVAAQGRSPKVVMLRVYLALLAAAQKVYLRHRGNNDNPADSYMTLLGYFNSLRELGGARRLIEDEVRTRLTGYGIRRRIGEAQGLFRDRKIAYDVVELTSRITTNRVAEAKRRLQLPFSDKEHVDVAIATNMISVGLDITRLGLMVAFGQPKTSSEYIQATSRVGRDDNRPGLVITILNIHKPRDRSHYERFGIYHQTFYRSVEASSVTPFSPRALDRALAATLVSLARHSHTPMTPATGAHQILSEYSTVSSVIDSIVRRAGSHIKMEPNESAALKKRVKDRCFDLLDTWSKIATDLNSANATLQYQREVGGATRLLYEFLSPELADVHPRFKKFRANRSMRDVEASVNLWVKRLDKQDIDDEE